MYSIDWHVIKKFQIYNTITEKLICIPPTREDYDKFFDKLSGKDSFYIEEGGGDTFKLLALKYGHKVFTTQGKKVKDLRVKLDIRKTDESDAVVIGILAKEQPQEFHEYVEEDILTMNICIIYREYIKRVKITAREKNQRFAFENKMELLTSKKIVAKLLEKKEITIQVLENEKVAMRNQLFKLLEKHPLWINLLGNIEGVGPVTAGGIIGTIRRFSRFPSKYSLRHFVGVVPKKDHHDYNRKAGQPLYNFVEQIIKKRTQPWRELYDNMKVYYKEKHSDWSPAKVNDYAKKHVKKKFLDMLWKKGIEIEN